MDQGDYWRSCPNPKTCATCFKDDQPMSGDYLDCRTYQGTFSYTEEERGCVYLILNILLTSANICARCWGTRSSPYSAQLPLLPTGSLALSCQTQAVSLMTTFLNVLQPIDYLHKVVPFFLPFFKANVSFLI